MPAGYRVRMIRRPLRTLLAALTVGATVVLGGCTTPSPDPTPTPTGFADEAAAFAAAEATYRAYVDALNERRKDPDYSPPPEQFLSGAALKSDAEARRQLAGAGLSIVGESTVERVIPGAFEPSGAVSITVCLDSSGTTVIDGEGTDRTPLDRATTSRLNVDLELQSNRWLISDSQLLAEDQC
jgi:hypothetical protein